MFICYYSVMSMKIVIEKIVAGGDGMGKINGKNVFVPYSIPGEELNVEITKSYRDYDVAKIVEVLKPSPHRVVPFCPMYGICGGCNMQHIDSAYQVEIRKQILADCFEREGLKVPEIQVVSGSDRGYRARIQLTDGGFNEKDSNKIVPINECPILTEEINGYLKNTPFNDRPHGRVHVFGDERVAMENKVIVANETKKRSDDIQIVGAGNSRKSKVKAKKNLYFKGTSGVTDNVCSIKIGDKNISFDVLGFFQSNPEVLEKTVDVICDNMGGKNVLDMYAGCGTFSVFLSDIFEKTTLVEHNRDAIVFAERNLVGTNHESYGQSGDKWVKQNASLVMQQIGSFDAVVIDPPRQGIEKAVCQWLCEHKTGQIRSVSCNPSTHARDARYLVQSGYILSKLFLLDFYPQTSHIESLAFFENYA